MGSLAGRAAARGLVPDRTAPLLKPDGHRPTAWAAAPGQRSDTTGRCLDRCRSTWARSESSAGGPSSWWCCPAPQQHTATPPARPTARALEDRSWPWRRRRSGSGGRERRRKRSSSWGWNSTRRLAWSWTGGWRKGGRPAGRCCTAVAGWARGGGGGGGGHRESCRVALSCG